MGSPARTMNRKYTYADYLTWPDEERWEIIDGEAYDMTPAPTTRHQRISRKLSTLFDNFFAGKPCEPFFAPTDVVLDDHNIVQPDILVVCTPSKVTEKNIQGAPDLAVEILSPSTSVKDRREKRRLYERFGVREYLIVDPAAETVDRFTLTDGRYSSPDIFAVDEILTSTAFPDLTLNLRELFGKELPTDDGSRLEP